MGCIFRIASAFPLPYPYSDGPGLSTRTSIENLLCFAVGEFKAHFHATFMVSGERFNGMKLEYGELRKPIFALFGNV